MEAIIISIGDTKIIVSKRILKDQNRDLVLAEHRKDRSKCHRNVVAESSSNVNVHVLVSLVEMEHIVEGGNCWQTSSVNQNHSVLTGRQLGVDTLNVDEVAKV